jgi:hypothetical protein
MSEFQSQLRHLIANRRTQEARALYTTLAQYAHRRVESHRRNRYPDLLSASESEELVAEVLYQLMSGALARFRGSCLPELLGFVRTITDRTVWRAARRKREELTALEGAAGEAVREWTHAPPGPEAAVRILQDSPMPHADQDYLVQLLEHGSKADLARATGVSRAAVTQRVKRIQDRIAAMPERDQDAVESWLHAAAHRALLLPRDGGDDRVVGT